MKRQLRIMCLLWLALAGLASAQSPFRSRAELAVVDGKEQLHVQVLVPPNHYLYANMLAVVAESPVGVELLEAAPPKPKKKYDEVFQKDVEVFESDLSLKYEVVGRGSAPLKVKVSYQGCQANVCFLPQDDSFVLTLDGESAVAEQASPQGDSPADDGPRSELDRLASQYKIGGSVFGYVPRDEFLTFLEEAKAGTVAKEEDGIVQQVFRKYGLLAVMLVLIPLGFMLNLTPCVLPMIPINLAIIGAGAQSGSKKRGFGLGAVYGAGMAAVYGLLGLVVVLTGQQFGALNSSPWFSLGIAILFAALALAMFDVFIIDLSRFQRRSATGDDKAKAPFVTAFVLGGTAALLAGACVAPVLISVLVLAANLYRSNPVALLLPFMLGVGMASPWPFAGAGMSFLPKPGPWMDWVKRVFGVLILLAAFYYGALAVEQFRPATGEHRKTDVAAALQRGLREGKPVFLDFWGLSCKACKKMEQEVFPRPDVKLALEDFVFAGVQSDLQDREDVVWAEDYFDIKGLPTYIVLIPAVETDGTQ